MPFIALNKPTGSRVDITQATPALIRQFTPGELVCQLCGGPMFPRSAHDRTSTQGAKHEVRAHFVHVAKECDATYRQHPESADHRRGKLYVATDWLMQYGRYKGAVIEYEVPIKDIRRIADVLATLPNGHRIAHEVQLAGITPRELEERTNDYARAGIDVYWHLGKSADTQANRDFLAGALEDFGIISFNNPPNNTPSLRYRQSLGAQR